MIFMKRSASLFVRPFRWPSVLALLVLLTAIAFTESVVQPVSAGPTNYGGRRARPITQSIGWNHRLVVHNEGSRSEYEIGHLTCRTIEIDPIIGQLVTPIGEFHYQRGRENNWKPVESPGWVKNEEASARSTAQAGLATTEFTVEDRARRWYRGGFDARRRNTPGDWFYLPEIKAWADPEHRADYEKLYIAVYKLKRLVEAVEEFRRRVGDTPGNLELLVTGPRGRRDWSPIVRRDELNDPWGGMYEIENFARLHARTEGRNFAIRSKGPDRTSGSGDDLDLPEPVNPKPSPFEGLIER
jgi:hypothetical protein